MSKFRIYPSKENSIASGYAYENLNSSQENVFSLWYGGGVSSEVYNRNSISRHLMYFDLSDLQSKISDFTINSAYTVSYKLKITNAIPSDKVLESEFVYDVLNKSIASSFDLIAFPINKSWDEGRGLSLDDQRYITFKNQILTLTGYSNWLSATSQTSWSQNGIFTNPTGSTYSGITTQSGMTVSTVLRDSSTLFTFVTSGNTNMANGAISATTSGNNISVDFASFYYGTTGFTGMTFTISNQVISTGWTFTTSANTVMADASISATTIGNDVYVSFSGDSITTDTWYSEVFDKTAFSGFGMSVVGFSPQIYISSAGTSTFTLSANTLSDPISTTSWLNTISGTSFSGLGITITGDSSTSYIGDNTFYLSAYTSVNNVNFYSSQHFPLGSENIDMDVTSIVNDWLSGGSQNNGLAIAYSRPFELISSDTRYIASFYTNKTNYAFKPYLEANYNQVIKDDRNWVTNNRTSRLFLYLFSGNQATNYYSAGTVTIKNNANTVITSGLTPVHHSKGVYYVDVLMTGATKSQRYKDVWENVTFQPGIDQTTFTQIFEIRDNYYNNNAKKINDYAIDIYGISNNSTITSDEIHRVYVDVRMAFSQQKPHTDFGLEYKITMGLDETIPWTSMNNAIIDDCLSCFFDLDTSWLLNAQIYKIEFRIVEFGTKRLIPDAITFRVVNPV